MEKQHKKLNHKLLGALVVITAALLFGVVAGAQIAAAVDANGASESVAARDARMTWWREARFGMFIHFGLYAIPGRGEWVQWDEQIPVGEYAKLTDQFTLTNSPQSLTRSSSMFAWASSSASTDA